MGRLIRLWTYLAVAALSAVTSTLNAQPTGELRGRVSYASSGEPAAGARVLIATIGRSVSSGDDGRYQIQKVPPGRHRVIVTLAGLKAETLTVEIAVGEVVLHDIDLRRQAVTPDAEIVTVRGDSIISAGPRVVRGIVRDTAGHPVPSVTVRVGDETRAVTNDSGAFRVELPDRRRVSLDVRRLGFQPAQVRLPEGSDTTVSISLFPLAQPLPETVVETDRSRALDLHGFYRRMADREKGINSGFFITREEIEKRNPTRFVQMLEGIPSVLIKPHGLCAYMIYKCYAPMGSSGCYMNIFLDGHRLNKLTLDPYSQPWGINTDWPDELISPTSIAGIEVYPRQHQAPPRYQMLGGCGVILVWTK